MKYADLRADNAVLAARLERYRVALEKISRLHHLSVYDAYEIADDALETDQEVPAGGKIEEDKHPT